MNDINEIETIIPGLSSELTRQFQDFFSLLEQYNSKINLVGKSTVSRAGVKHFADCYMGLKCIADYLKTDSPIFDFGSGNGFPGIIAGMMFPDQTFLMVERDQRKAEFLKIAINQLKLKNVEVYAGNVSELADSSCQKIISRAMAPLPKFLLETRAVTAPGGEAFLFKGAHWSTEFSAVPAQVFDYWEVDLAGAYELPNDEGKRFVVHCKRV